MGPHLNLLPIPCHLIPHLVTTGQGHSCSPSLWPSSPIQVHVHNVPCGHTGRLRSAWGMCLCAISVVCQLTWTPPQLGYMALIGLRPPGCTPSLLQYTPLTCACAGAGDHVPSVGHARGCYVPPAEEWHAHHRPVHAHHEQGAHASLSGVVCGLTWCSVVWQVVQSILLIKLYTWEMFFTCKIGMLHKAEVHHV